MKSAKDSRQAGVDAVELSTEDDLVDSIMRFAELRKQRSRLAAGIGPAEPIGRTQ